MEFKELMYEVKKFVKKWESDETLNEMYDKDSLKKEFLKCIQLHIDSDFVILSKEELQKQKEDFHNSMEGYPY